MRMRLCIGSAACWKAARILSMWLADWSALPARMWVSEMITKLLLNPSSRLRVLLAFEAYFNAKVFCDWFLNFDKLYFLFFFIYLRFYLAL